jgi:hypothetical protein
MASAGIEVTRPNWLAGATSRSTRTTGWLPTHLKQLAGVGFGNSTRCSAKMSGNMRSTRLYWTNPARRRIGEVAGDYPRVWNDERTSPVERKKMLGLLI